MNGVQQIQTTEKAKEADKNALEKAVGTFRDLVWSQSSGTASAVGSTLPVSVIADTSKLWRLSGEVACFLRSFEILTSWILLNRHMVVGGYMQIVAQQPVAVERVMDKVRARVKGHKVVVTADGSKVNFPIEAMLVGFVRIPLI